MKKLITALFTLLVFAASAPAADKFEIDASFVQNEFDGLIKDLSQSVWFNPMAPAETLGILGFDVAAEVTYVDIDENSDYWDKALADNTSVDVGIPLTKIHVAKGLPFGIDVGAHIGSYLGLDAGTMGFELKYDILGGNVALPAISLRASYSELTGVDDIDLSTTSLGAHISKGILFLTPYAGIEYVMYDGSESSDSVSLDSTDGSYTATVVGLQIVPFPLLNLTLEVAAAENTQYGMKLGVRF